MERHHWRLKLAAAKLSAIPAPDLPLEQKLSRWRQHWDAGWPHRMAQIPVHVSANQPLCERRRHSCFLVVNRVTMDHPGNTHPGLTRQRPRWSKFVLKQFLSLIHISEPTRQAEISYAVFCLK